MDNIDLRNCVNQDTKELSKIYCGIITKDDVPLLNKNLESFRQFLVTALLENNVENFPLAFIMNTGTHQSGGIHWQGLYFDQNHRAYFFDSYGRKPMDQFKIFADLILIFSFMRQYYRKLPLSEVLSQNKFTPNLYKRMMRRQKKNTNKYTFNYFNLQLQSDFTNVCGEYSLMFLYAISRQSHPELYGYDYYLDQPAVFTPINPKKEVNMKHHQLNYIFMANDYRIRNIVKSKFGFFKKNILS